MRLRKATLIAIIGVSYNFALRTIGTFLPDIFKITVVAQTSQIISLLASLAFLSFFVLFHRDWVQEGHTELRKPSALAIIGSSAILLPRTKSLVLVFRELSAAIYERSPFLFRLIRTDSLGVILSWLGSIFILYFFIMFHKETLRKKLIKLQKATLLASIGSSIGTLLVTLTLLNYLYYGEVRWSYSLLRTIALIFLPISMFGFVAVLYFFLIFYKSGIEEHL